MTSLCIFWIFFIFCIFGAFCIFCIICIYFIFKDKADFKTSLYSLLRVSWCQPKLSGGKKRMNTKWQNRRFLELSLFQHLREGTWQSVDSGCRPPALNLGTPSLVFWGCKICPLCTSCIFLWLGEGRPPGDQFPGDVVGGAPRCGRSAWSRPSCLDGWRSFCDSNIWTIPIILHILHISQLMR